MAVYEYIPAPSGVGTKVSRSPKTVSRRHRMRGAGGEELEACKDGVNHKGDSEYCDNKYSNQPEKIKRL